MSWQKEVDELNHRLDLAKAMGGPANVARHHARGKLTARERIDGFADPGSFDEFMGLIGTATYDGATLTGFLPKPTVEGMVRIDGRRAVVVAGDFTVRGGSGGAGSALGREPRASERAMEWRLPFIRLLDGAGGSVRTFEEVGRTYLPDGNSYTAMEVQLLSKVPVASAILGSVAGIHAVVACLGHFNVMVKDISQIFPGGPPVVKQAHGIDITKEELGGDQIHTRISGCVDNLAETDADAFAQVRRFLSYLPLSVDEMPPRGPVTDDPDRAEEALLSLMPRNPRQAHNARRLIEHVVDRDSFFEIAPHYGRARITGLARIDGYPVALMANNPRFNGGSTDVAEGNKAMRLMALADTFHLPLISLCDEPGFMVGPAAERMGIERAGARMVAAVCSSRMPWITIVVGRLFGVAGQCHHRPSGMYRRYAWPSATWGSMHISGGVSAAYRREIEAAPDPAAKQAEIEARLQAIASPFRTAEATGQDIIDPRHTRRKLVDFVHDAQRVLQSQVGVPWIPYMP